MSGFLSPAGDARGLESPFLLSGLALAEPTGARKHYSEDGILTAEEIATLDL